MMAVVTTGTGGYDRLDYRRVPIPVPGPNEVLVAVRAAGINNTDINTRLGWYAPSVRAGTGAAAAETGQSEEGQTAGGQTAGVQIAGGQTAGGWSGATPFPLIQGTDCCGRIVAVGPGADAGRIGARVLVRPCMRQSDFTAMQTRWLGSDFDGSFAQFVKVPERETFTVAVDWSDGELATIPCAYGTAENMVHRAKVGPGDRVLVPGASGGVGSAVIQLVKRRGAEVIAVTSAAKRASVREIGADRVLTRDEDPLASLGAQSVDVVIDNVGGPGFATLLKLLRRGGRYVSSGAIAGPVVELDLRDMYLKDLSLIGCTAWEEPVFANLISYIERGEIRPLLAASYPLEQIAEAQRVFQEKNHTGKIVLIPPP
ncbi:zinc-binding dehydrogenase [bacterium]|nr:zinc-binding dehydrogenase [bacterium]